jgi:5-(carboxyamino)imidazole ribonucleotide synthase
MDTRTGLPVVGMVGGGPLVRMSHQAATALGQSLRALATDIGAPPDLDALLRFAEGCDVVTVVDAAVPGEHLQALAARGRTVFPNPVARRHAQDLRLLRDALARLGVATAEHREPVGQPLSAVVARSPWGQAAAYPVARTLRRDGAGTEVLAPAPGLDEARVTQAQRLAIGIATELDVVGLLAVQLHESGDELRVGDLALRPHDSALWTVEGARTSQFEQHLRAVLDYPLGETRLTAPAVATVSVRCGRTDGMGIDERLHHLFAEDPGARVHLYGERPQVGRVLGHVTVLGDDMAQVRRRAQRAAGWLADGSTPQEGHPTDGDHGPHRNEGGLDE